MAQAPQLTQRKRTRGEDSSRSSQAHQEEPPWERLFSEMSLVKDTFNSRFDQLEINFNQRFDQVDSSILHLQHDVHTLYEHQGYSCSYAPYSHPPPPPSQDP